MTTTVFRADESRATGREADSLGWGRVLRCLTLMVMSIACFIQLGCSSKAADPVSVTSIAMTPQAISIPAGTSQAFALAFMCSNGAKCAAAGPIQWSSSDVAIAKVDSSGRATALKPGLVTISARDTVAGVMGSAKLTVTAALLKSIALTPPKAQIPAGTNQAIVATGTYGDDTTKDITASVQWSSSAPSILDVDANGLAKGRIPGAATITARDAASGLSGSMNITVTDAVLASIGVTPASGSSPLGTTEKLVAMGTYSDGSSKDISASVAWSSSDVTIATVDASGLASAIGVGAAMIIATDSASSIAGNALFNVTPAVLTSIDLSPAMPTLPKGVSQQLAAKGTYSDKTTKDITASLAYTSSNPAIVTVDAAGKVTAASIGTATITATDSGSMVNATLSIAAVDAALVSIAVSPDGSSVALGLTQVFNAKGTYTDGTSNDITGAVTWTSSDATIASISNADGSRGLATSAAVGSVAISAKDPASGISGSAKFSVSPAVLRTVVLAAASASLPNGTSLPLTAKGVYSDASSKDLTASLAWSSSDATIATVSNADGSRGVVTAVAMGKVTISVKDADSGVTASYDLTVTAAVLRSLAVSAASPSVVVGSTDQFTTVGTYSDGSTKDITALVAWSSSDSTIATISNTAGSFGLVSGVAAGTVTITATDSSSGITSSASLTVNAAM